MRSILLTSIFVLLFANTLLAEEKCNDLKKLSRDYLKCVGEKLKDKTSNIGLDTNNIKEKKYLTDWFKKKNEL